jgi:hypothetical protein
LGLVPSLAEGRYTQELRKRHKVCVIPDYYEDLVFPLIDTFCSIIKRDNIKLDKIIVFLTDQSNIFEEWQRLNEKCPYWQDTLTLDSLLIKYFQDNLNITPEFKTNANNAMLTWLRLLEKEFGVWKNLTWSCDYYKDRESDLRNQLMHNLRGMEDDDVIKYLLGRSNQIPKNATVIEVYEQDVKKPFIKAIKLLHLHYKSEDLQSQLQNIASRI